MFVGNVGYEVCRCGAVGVVSVQVSWEFLGPNYLADRLYLVFDHLILIYDLLRK